MAKKNAVVEQQEPERAYHRVEFFHSFAARHGDFVEVGDVREVRPGVFSGKLIFEDGATAVCKHPIHHGGQESPTEFVAHGRARRAYAVAKLAHERLAYEKFYSDCCLAAGYHAKGGGASPPPPANWKEQLAKGEKSIARWEARLKELDEILAPFEEILAARQARQEARQSEDEKRRALLDEVFTYGGRVPHTGDGTLSSPDPM